MSDLFRVLSLGAGVQSSTLLLMAAAGELGDIPDVAIFADTGWEPKAVYEWLDWLEDEVRGRVPVIRVSAGNIRDEILEKNTRYASPPFHLLNLKGEKGMTRRQCTKGYKIEPIEKKVRELVGLKPRQRAPRHVIAERWFGISADEVMRMRVSALPWQVYRYPLVDLNMTRASCLAWMERNGYPKPPRSACLGCPFHSDEEWRHIRDNDAEGWADAVDFDRQIRLVGLKGLNAIPFLHASLKPLDEVDLTTAEERGQGHLFDGFANECEGMCGV
jgi:hypothetical protein